MYMNSHAFRLSSCRDFEGKPDSGQRCFPTLLQRPTRNVNKVIIQESLFQPLISAPITYRLGESQQSVSR